MARKTIPKRRGRMSKQDPPVYRKLVSSMAFDPFGLAPAQLDWEPWQLDDQYKPSVGELVGTLAGRLMPTLEMEEVQGDQEGAGATARGDAVAPGGSGQVVPGELEDGDPLGGFGEDRGDQDPGRSSQVS